MERLDKIMSTLGILSRSECKKAIKQGLISVNGVTVSSSDLKINPDVDDIVYKNEHISSSSVVYYMLNKPAGVITAKEDKFERTVFDLINDTRRDLAAVGRLDKDTTGLLLITNDGDLNHYLLSPKHHVNKRYEVLIESFLSKENITTIENGVDIGDDTPTLPAVVEILDTSETNQTIALTITEGRYHQVKRMLSAVNHPVIKLHRSGFGPLVLDDKLKPGEYRELTKEEIKLINLKPQVSS